MRPGFVVQASISGDLRTTSELVQLKLNIEASVGESTPTEVEIGTPTYRSGSLGIDKGDVFLCLEKGYAILNAIEMLLKS